MENKKWSDDLTEDQQKLMNIIAGTLADIPVLFEFLTKDMDARQSECCKIGFIQRLLESMGIADAGFWDQEGNYKQELQEIKEEEL